MLPGTGTALNVAAVAMGTSLGVLIGGRLPSNTRVLVTDAIGLMTLLVAGLNASAITSAALREDVGRSAVLIVLGAVLLGALVGSALHIEERLAGWGEQLREAAVRRLGPRLGEGRFVDGFVSASLIFCVGPLTVLGALDDGLGRGIDQLALKSVLDGFTALALAAVLGWGVGASIVTIVVVQGGFTLLGVWVGDVMTEAELAALTATGGVLLAGIGLRLLDIRQVRVADLLPALLLAPLLVWLVASLR